MAQEQIENGRAQTWWGVGALLLVLAIAVYVRSALISAHLRFIHPGESGDAHIAAATTAVETFDFMMTIAGALLIAIAIALKDKLEEDRTITRRMAAAVGGTSGLLASAIYIGLQGRAEVGYLLVEGGFDARVVSSFVLVQLLCLAIAFVLMVGIAIHLLSWQAVTFHSVQDVEKDNRQRGDKPRANMIDPETSSSSEQSPADPGDRPDGHDRQTDHPRPSPDGLGGAERSGRAEGMHSGMRGDREDR